MSQTNRTTRRSVGRPVYWTPKLIGFLVLLVLSLILLLQNWEHVDVNVLFWTFTIRLVWMLLIVFLLGTLLGWLGPRLRAGLH